MAGAQSRVVEIGTWPPADADRALALEALERGEVALLPTLGFALEPAERVLLDPSISDGRAKNVSLDPATGRMGGARLEGERLALARAMMGRFADWSLQVVKTLLPRYAGQVQRARTSFRPCEVEDRPQSPRKDDRRLHVDAFPSQPVQGRRILRLFANIDPEGRPRVWRVGEPFEAFAAGFAPKLSAAPPGEALALRALGLTKGRRTAYDHAMLGLHDRAKEDDAWQASAPREEARFAAGSTWIVFTDATLHAAIAGQHALEQTFLLPVASMAEPERAPLRVLERLLGRGLV